MNIKFVSFSAKGCRTAYNISRMLMYNIPEYECEAFASQKYIEDDYTGPLTESLDEWTGRQFKISDAIVFVCACGIAVRAIAPYVRKKTKDPAVIVVDELGRYVVPILSGHIGGANEIAVKIADITGGEAVITTATDINRKFAVDTFAKANELAISDFKLAKEISSAVLRGEKIGLICDFDIKGRLPDSLVLESKNTGTALKIHIGYGIEADNDTLVLTPKDYVIGMGCRRGKSFEELRAAACEAAQKAGITLDEVCALASVDLKADEEGILQLCREYGLKKQFYTAQELSGAEGDFSPSDFVKSNVGVDNVCERAAYLASGCGDIILKKLSKNGVTAAVAVKKEKKTEVCFE